MSHTGMLFSRRYATVQRRQVVQWAGMRLTRLTLTNFRNYRHLDLPLAPGLSLFYGGNAQGKTNLLEATYLLAVARSHRATADRELVHWQAAQEEGYALLNAEAERRDGRLTLRMGLQCVRPAGSGDVYIHKRIRVNGVPCLASELVGQLNAVLFSAEDIAMIHGAPSLRRRYLDVLLSQADGAYLRALQQYQRALTQRNHLLRALREGRAHSEELLFWDQTLSREGGVILERRQQALEHLGPLAAQVFHHLTGASEALELSYLCTVSSDLNGDATTLAEAMRQALARSRDRETALGMTVVGPHRDDLRCTLGGVDMAVYASRGQARAVALTLRLAESRFLEERRGEQPVLLLDDVLSELDPQRRRLVLAAIAGHEQVLVTATDVALFEQEALAGVHRFRVAQGTVTPE